MPDAGRWSDGHLSIAVERRANGLAQVTFENFASFQIDVGSHRIRVHQGGALSRETLRHFLLDQIYPRILAHEGQLVLHAAGVTLCERAVLFVGPSGSGKSTLAASFHGAGHPLLGDDAIVVESHEGCSDVRSVYRSLRLFQDSLTEILPGVADLSPVADYTDKWNVEGLGKSRATEALRLGAIFLLQPSPCGRIRIETAAGAEACMVLVEQSFALDPTSAAGARQRLAQASQLAASAPMFRLHFPRDFRMLADVREAVSDALERSRSTCS